ncbi:linear amide C-N hydrolase [Halodesulfovibrio sp. MK-HDV]|jgi:choloylglycine hydrolase|uniref:linear amide C-N hydrolase n=1 Tax=Halodesulfovibrio sp. MK-HDV TaxID=2599925 RepID=UPI00136BA1D6|nr:choloylglycine hydrolase family protein [Halodesulfovibrio sp. MK-HDV]KAF1077827.1 putative protein YxeI [Halodesulfovibrio sp. MK-HDV]
MLKIKWLLVLFCCAILVSNATIAQACTGVKTQATDGAVAFARTLEFGTPLKSDILFVPRGQDWVSPAPDGNDGMTWQNKYAFLGPNAFGEKMFVDGINEKELYLGGFWFPGIASFPKATDNDAANIIAPQAFGAFILGTCATLDEVRKAISKIQLVGVTFKKMGMILPMHWIIMDKTGKSIVVEPINGKIVVADNPVNVFTNSPPFAWHLQNLSNYANLTSRNSAPTTIRDYNVAPIGQGSGMVGLPGDFTPPSRFVRMALLSNSVESIATADEAVNQAFLLINNISIVKGVAVDIKPDDSVSADYTQWTAVYDLKRHRCYFRTYDNQDIRMVQLDKLPLESDQILTIPMWNSKPEYKDITKQAK